MKQLEKRKGEAFRKVKRSDLNLIWSLFSTETTPIKQESDGVEIHRLTVTVSGHQLLQLSGPLDPKKDFISILSITKSTKKKN